MHILSGTDEAPIKLPANHYYFLSDRTPVLAGAELNQDIARQPIGLKSIHSLPECTEENSPDY